MIFFNNSLNLSYYSDAQQSSVPLQASGVVEQQRFQRQSKYCDEVGAQTVPS